MDVNIPRMAGSLDELVDGATDREPVRPADARSGAAFERLRIDGRGYFLKVLSAEADWIMRVTGNTTHWELTAWKAGLYDEAPAEVDHTMVAMALDRTGPATRLAMLMTDCTDDLVPPGDTVLPADQHARFIDHLAAMHSAKLGWTDTLGLQELGAAVPVLRTRDHRLGARRPRRTRPAPGRERRLAPTATSCTRPRRPGPRDPCGSALLGPGDAHDAIHVRGRRLEAGQPRLPARRPHDRPRLGLPR